MAAEREMEWVRRNGRERIFLSYRQQQQQETHLAILTPTYSRGFRRSALGCLLCKGRVVGVRRSEELQARAMTSSRTNRNIDCAPEKTLERLKVHTTITRSSISAERM